MRRLLIILSGLIISGSACGNAPQGRENFEDLVKSGKDVFFKDMTFAEDIDFTQFEKNLISEGVYQVRIISSITFQNCTFNGKVSAYRKNKDNSLILAYFQSNLSFIGCVFKNDVTFRAASVMGRTDFTNASFLKTSTFEECTFYQNAYFRASTYHEEARFQNSVFMQKANFLNAEFDVTASFQLSVFNSEAQFSSTKFMGYADFGLINCKGNFLVNYAEFANRSIFNSGLYYGQVDLMNVSFKRCEIKNCKFFGDVRLMKSSAEEFIDFSDSYFLLGLPDISSFDQEKLNMESIKTGN
jgi:hypothetical protein